MIAFALFRVFVSLVNANEEFKKLPTKEHFNKAYPNAKSIPECPTDDRGYKHIEEEPSSYSSDNYFACNKKFRNPIIINQGLLLIYNCNFTNTRSPASSEGVIRIIATDESLTEPIEIHNCYFYKIQFGAIHIEAKEANIVDCSFEKCYTDSYTIASAIYLKISTGTIKNSFFFNNNELQNNVPDIKYENYDQNGKLIFEGNKFKRSAGSFNDGSNIIAFDSNSLFDFINNFVMIPYEAAGVKLFDWPQELTDISNYKFEGNMMYPSNPSAVSVTNNLLNGKFPVKSDFQCPPDTIGDSQVTNLCGTSSREIEATNLVNIIYCTFYSITNLKSKTGGAVYINIDENMQTYDEPIRIYDSNFVYCDADYGCAMYIESYHDSLLFDFRDCYFGENYVNREGYDMNLMKGGAIYIKTKYTPFEFNRCSFNENKAGDGGAVFYISDTSDSLEKEEKTSDSHKYTLHFIDCRFHHNEAYSNGAGICILMTGREHKKPILIEGCIFYQCQANNWDASGTRPEEPENGGGIYYSASYTKLVESESEHNLYINNCCFANCISSFRGGGIFISVLKEEPSRCIEIYDCSFTRNNIDGTHCLNNGECYSGKDLFFEFNSASSSTPFSNTNLLIISNCYSYMGSMSLYVADKEPSKPIEINECTFLSYRSETRGAIKYIFSATSNSASTTSGEKTNSLLVANCFFKSYQGADNGGAISIEIANIEPSNPIEIRGCNFNLNKANLADAKIGCGGSIYYIQKASSYSTNYGFSVFDCIFTRNKASYYGGAIYIELEKAGESSHIEINNCSFTNNEVLQQDNGIGASIYYHMHKQASSKLLSASLLDDVITFAVRNCNFTGGVATQTGEVYVEIAADEPTRNVEFTKCIFKDSKPEAVYFNSHSAFIHLKDCDFMTTSTVYFANDVASAKVELCRFTDLSNRPITYISDSQTFSDDHEFRVENCEFTQLPIVDCLFYFATKLSSHFYFYNNSITINNDETRALGSKEAMTETGWHFYKNTIKPGKEGFIKTETAKLIQASCQIGFICDEAPPSQCNQHIRCEFDSANDDGDDGSTSIKDIKDFHYKDNKYEEDGAAIHVKNYALQCDQSTFTDCHAQGQHGGGAIYIYLDQVVSNPVKLENLKFTNCEAFYGGAIFVYSDQIDNEVSITQCRFEQNMAQKEATNEGEVYFGGGAVFMVAANGNILHCKFIGNAGPAVKLYNSFEKLKESQKSLKDDSSSSSSLSIEDCIFEPGDNYKSSIFYLRGSKEETKVEVKNCIFKGKMADGSYHIDGDSLSKKESPMNLHIKSCKFTGAKINNDKLIFGSFENNQIQKINTKSSSHGKLGLISLVLAGVSCFAIVLAFFAYFMTKKSQQSSSSEDSNSEL